MSEQPPQPPGTPRPPAGPGGEPGAPVPPPTAPPTTPPTTPPPPLPPSSPGGYGPPPHQAGHGYGGGPVAGMGGLGGGQLSQSDERTWGMLAHVSAIVAAVIGLSFIGPLVVMLVQGPKSDYVRRQSVEALNFQITTYVAAFVSFILVFVLIGILLLIVVGIAWLVLTIMAAVAANRGEDYRYPLNMRLIK